LDGSGPIIPLVGAPPLIADAFIAPETTSLEQQPLFP